VLLMTQIREKRYGARFSGSVVTQQPTYFVYKEENPHFISHI
jgi:hypothetical protein